MEQQCFSSLKKQKQQLNLSHKVPYKMETQKVINLLNDSSNDESKFATKNDMPSNSETAKNKYNQNSSIKFETESIKSSLCDYSDVFILVTGDIKVTANNDTDVAFKICAPFSTCKTEINDVFIDEANHTYIVTMPMYKSIECNGNYSDTSRSLWQFKRDEVPNNNADFIINTHSFKYKAANAVHDANSSAKDTKIVVPLKYLSNFWRSLEMSLINRKIHLELNWIKDFISSSARDSAKCKIADAKLHVPKVTLSTEDKINLTKQLWI